MTIEEALEKLKRVSAARKEETLGLVITNKGNWMPIVAYVVDGMRNRHFLWDPLEDCCNANPIAAIEAAASRLGEEA